MKPILYIDMDNVLVDFPSGIARLDPQTFADYEGRYDEVEGIFALMAPMPNAIKAVHKLMQKYQIYVLSTAPWHNPSAWSDKVKWIQRYFGEEKGSPLYKRLILSHHKNLNEGDYLIDDRTKNGVDKFKGEHIHFGTEKFANWNCVLSYLGIDEFTPSMILSDCLKCQAALFSIENDEQSRKLAGFADRYKWQVFCLTAEYDEMENTEQRTVYLVIGKHHHDQFVELAEGLAKYMASQAEILLVSKQQIKQYFEGLCELPFQRVSHYAHQPLYKAGNVMGMWARDTAINAILKEIKEGKYDKN